MRRQCGLRLFAHRRLACKGFINRLAERVPQFLLKLAIKHHGVRFFLPTLLQGFHRIHAQSGRSTQSLRLSNQGMTACQAGFLRSF